ncbi:MAG TPA: sulfotransferase [Terriglobales bacterium]
MKLPNFLILGAAKGGTTSLYAYLRQHPQVFMTVPKEPTFFGHEGTDGLFNGPHDEDRAYHSRVITNFADYCALYKSVTDQKAVGEASVYSLYLPHAPEQIRKYVPNAIMFAVLRNPADRAYSAYLHVRRQAREKFSFAEALKREPERIHQNWNPLWHFKAMGFYYEQVKRYYDMFGRDQVHVYLYEDFKREPLAVVKQVLDILGVSSRSFTPDMSKRYKKSYVPRYPALEKFFHQSKIKVQFASQHWPEPLRWRAKYLGAFLDRLAEPNRIAPPPIPQDVRASLLSEYHDDIRRLSDLLRRDLSDWCNTVPVAAGHSA